MTVMRERIVDSLLCGWMEVDSRAHGKPIKLVYFNGSFSPRNDQNPPNFYELPAFLVDPQHIHRPQ